MLREPTEKTIGHTATEITSFLAHALAMNRKQLVHFSPYFAGVHTHLFVEDDPEVAPADGGIRELHEVRPSKHSRLLASTDAPALGDAKGLVVPVRVRGAQALRKKTKRTVPAAPA